MVGAPCQANDVTTACLVGLRLAAPPSFTPLYDAGEPPGCRPMSSILRLVLICARDEPVTK